MPEKYTIVGVSHAEHMRARGAPEETQQVAADEPTQPDAPRRELPAAAKRALAEAQARREAAEREAAEAEKVQEIGGRKGPEPVRYGDWEKDGIAWDF